MRGADRRARARTRTRTKPRGEPTKHPNASVNKTKGKQIAEPPTRSQNPRMLQQTHRKMGSAVTASSQAANLGADET